jgi:hypothetical protein
MGHRINVNLKSPVTSEIRGEEEEAKRRSIYRSLYHVININAFRFHLIRWIVKRHIPFTVIKDINFQAMLKVLTGTEDIPLLITGNSVRNKIEDEFVRAQNTVKKEVLARAISRIYVSCDLWSSPNGYVMCGVAAHFVGHQGTVQAVLLSLKRIRTAHRGEEITEVIINTIKQYEFKDNLGVFITDNTELNNVV